MRPRPSRSPLSPLAALGCALSGAGLLTLGSSCIVTYGGATGLRPEPLPAPNDIAEIAVRLEALVAEEAELDRRDRLVAALDLSRQALLMSEPDRTRVQAYLLRLVAIEERSQPMSAPILFDAPLPEVVGTFAPIGATVEEEDLGGVQELRDQGGDGPPSAEPPASGGSAPVPAGPPADASERDAWIFAERERAGAIFLRARAETDGAARAAKLAEAREILVRLLESFPDLEQAEAIQRNLELVEREQQASAP